MNALATLEKQNQTNDLNYPPIEVEGMTPITDRILVQWDFCQDFIKLGKFTLSRPDTHKKMHYVGTVLAVGPDVDDAIQIGDRLVFDQFSQFEKYWDETYGRVALLEESKQGPLFGKVPKRVKVEGSEPDFNYDV